MYSSGIINIFFHLNADEKDYDSKRGLTKGFVEGKAKKGQKVREYKIVKEEKMRLRRVLQRAIGLAGVVVLVLIVLPFLSDPAAVPPFLSDPMSAVRLAGGFIIPLWCMLIGIGVAVLIGVSEPR